MLKSFSTKKTSVGAAAAAVDFSGKWKNNLKSDMTLAIDASGKVTGKYRTGVGNPTPAEEFDLVGFATGDLLSFTVNFGQYGSLTSWVGQLTKDAQGVDQIKTMWLLSRNIADPDEDAGLWGSVLTGADFFFR